MKKAAVALSILALSIVIGVIWLFPDMLRLRAGVTPGASGVKKVLSWTPDENEEPGDRQVIILAQDAQGNKTSEAITIHVLASDQPRTPQISNVVITPGTTSALLTWDSDKPAVGGVDFDLRESPKHGLDATDKTLKRNHQITIPNLVACTTYLISLRVKTSDQEGKDADRTFTTKGCTGNAAVKDEIRKDFLHTQGGTVSLPNKVSLRVPANFSSQDGQFQIHQLDRDPLLEQVSAPAGLSAKSGLYEIHDLKGVAGSADIDTNFAQPITVTINYTPDANTDPTSLKIYRYDGSAWHVLDTCSVNEPAQEVSCLTTAFSTFGVFGQGPVTPDAPAASSSSSAEAPPSSSTGSSGSETAVAPSSTSGGGGGGGGGGVTVVAPTSASSGKSGKTLIAPSSPSGGGSSSKKGASGLPSRTATNQGGGNSLPISGAHSSLVRDAATGVKEASGETIAKNLQEAASSSIGDQSEQNTEAVKKSFFSNMTSPAALTVVLLTLLLVLLAIGYRALRARDTL